MEFKTTKRRVSIKEKSTSENKLRLYLVWYQNHKRIWEATNEFYFITPKGVLERQHNKDVKIKVEALRNIRETQLFTGEIDEALEQKRNRNVEFHSAFESYLDSYQQKDKRVMQAVYKLFKEFAPPPLSTKQIDETLCIKFKDFLESRLNGETPQGYFARFKKFLSFCSKGKDKIFKQNPASDVRNNKIENKLEKDTLTIAEMKSLIAANCGNKEVKRAFLFACNTGLRFVDIKALKWQNIKDDSVQIRQAKTDINVKVFLNTNAKQFLGERGKEEEYVFSLPSHNATIKNLEYWAKRAGIEKHITFHCARHTFGTLLAFYENDILTISKLMGHTSLKHTTKYIRVADEMKKKAVESIPTF
ncbi:tyrosine-type recombinase/integrase [Emticicia soli]|uniref:Tyrosine-type recombinase/integrase n=1 Tax=Emticicia soli TaxID=2027878 RepID=A0ABW5J288_9BACT